MFKFINSGIKVYSNIRQYIPNNLIYQSLHIYFDLSLFTFLPIYISLFIFSISELSYFQIYIYQSLHILLSSVWYLSSLRFFSQFQYGFINLFLCFLFCYTLLLIISCGCYGALKICSLFLEAIFFYSRKYIYA